MKYKTCKNVHISIFQNINIYIYICISYDVKVQYALHLNLYGLQYHIHTYK